MKIFAKDTQQKILSHNQKKAERQNEKAKQNSLIKQQNKEKIAVLNQVKTACLEAAILGEKYLILGKEFINFSDLIEEILEENFFSYLIPEQPEFTEFLLKIKLQPLSDTEIANLNMHLNEHLAAIENSFKVLADNLFCELDKDHILFTLKEIQASDNIPQKMLAFNQIQKDLIEDFDNPYTPEHGNSNLKIDTARTCLILNFNSMKGLFMGSYLFMPPKDWPIGLIKWDEYKDDDVLNYEPVDDYFNFVGLGWLSTFHGKLFLTALGSLIDKKITSNLNTIELTLFEFSSGHRIVFENSAEIYTCLNLKGLIQLFQKLGYHTIVDKQAKDEITIKISLWIDMYTCFRLEQQLHSTN